MYKRIILLLISLFILNSANAEERFVPSQPVMGVSSLSAGMKGYMLTVLKGTEISRIPVTIVSVIPQKGGRSFRELILIRLKGRKLAQGMSGSPVYVDGKLIGAVRSGWQQSTQELALVMPIEFMTGIYSEYASRPEEVSLSPAVITGIDINTSGIQELSRKLGITLTQGFLPVGGTPDFSVSGRRLNPGDSISAMLIWGDVELSAVGTVTAVDKYGKFLAFGHDFLKRGVVSYPSGGAYVHEIVDSLSFPLKLASTTDINGTVTQDREQAIGGKFGYYAPSVSCEFLLKDLDLGNEYKYKFRTVADEFLTDELIEGICKGLAEDAWGRKGQGTMSVNIRIDGKNTPLGFARKDIFFSDNNIIDEAFKQMKTIISAYLTQPFSEIMPLGFKITVEVTQFPRVMLIEDVETVSEAKPGESVDITVKLRPWRSEPITRKFTMKIPDDASGVAELIVRGGGNQSFHQAGIEGGWKTIISLENMLSEFRAADANNQLIVELNTDRNAEILKDINKLRKAVKSKSKTPDLLPEEEEYLSETKERRIREGSLKIFRSEYYIDGLMRRVIHTESE